MTEAGYPFATLSKELVLYLSAHELTCATAESCTGGLIAAAITSISGASKVFLGGAVTYTNRIKQIMLSVDSDTLANFSAVSPETALEMAVGVRRITGCNIAVSVTGNAGPEPSEGKPVGTVFLGIDSPWCSRSVKLELPKAGLTREEIRQAAVKRALQLILETAEKNPSGADTESSQQGVG